jgi:hypothetical protein
MSWHYRFLIAMLWLSLRSFQGGTYTLYIAPTGSVRMLMEIGCTCEAQSFDCGGYTYMQAPTMSSNFTFSVCGESTSQQLFTTFCGTNTQGSVSIYSATASQSLVQQYTGLGVVDCSMTDYHYSLALSAVSD